MTSFSAWTQRLRQHGAQWRENSERLRKARSGLVSAESHSQALGSRVAPSADAFLTTWVEHLRTARDQAEQHADALETAALGYDMADDEQSARLAALMAWDERDDRPRPAPGPGESQ